MSPVVREERAKAKADFASFRDLVAWQKAMDVVYQVYGFTAQLPEEERFVLAVQMRRAAISVPSNIAEGWAGTPPAITFDSFISLAAQHTNFRRRQRSVTSRDMRVVGPRSSRIVKNLVASSTD